MNGIPRIVQCTTYTTVHISPVTVLCRGSNLALCQKAMKARPGKKKKHCVKIRKNKTLVTYV